MYPQMENRSKSKHNGGHGRDVVDMGGVQGPTLPTLKEILV